jgi:hypothetical protein
VQLEIVFVFGQQLFGIELVDPLNGSLALFLRLFFHEVANQRAHEAEVNRQHLRIGTEPSSDHYEEKIRPP